MLAAGADVVYMYSDPSCLFFAEEVNDRHLGNRAEAMVMGSKALVRRGLEWTTAERVSVDNKLRWVLEKLGGESLDSRL
eukprot:2962561-Pyramimonas_sp.AAC.1